MSNIKFVFQKKVHKIPPNVTNLQNVIDTIKLTYKQLNTVYLFAIINPEETESVAEIRNDIEFQQLKALYKQNQWPSIKLLVTETQEYQQILKDSWGLLNQSLVSLEKQSRDACTLFQPIQIDQSQQIAPQAGNQSTQAQVKLIDNAQNTTQVDFRQNEQLKQFIADIVDQRIRELGLTKKISIKDYKVTLTQKIPVFTAVPGKKITAQITLTNSGASKWFNAVLSNSDLDFHQQLNNVSNNECLTVTMDLPYVPEHFQQNDERIYKFFVLCYDDKQLLHKIEDPILITVKAPEQFVIVKKLKDLFPQKNHDELEKFVSDNKNKSYDELVEILLCQY